MNNHEMYALLVATKHVSVLHSLLTSALTRNEAFADAVDDATSHVCLAISHYKALTGAGVDADSLRAACNACTDFWYAERPAEDAYMQFFGLVAKLIEQRDKEILAVIN